MMSLSQSVLGLPTYSFFNKGKITLFCPKYASMGIPRESSSWKLLKKSHRQGGIKCLEGTNSSQTTSKKQELRGKSTEISVALDELERLKGLVKSSLDSVGDGDISLSPYDTAWVALVEDVHGGGGSPQFPLSLQWIADNQLPDGSWGDRNYFSAYDRLLHTLACAVALTRWNVHPQAIEKGLSFVRENIGKLEDETLENMLAGFEVVFPALMDMAMKLDMQVPHDSSIMQKVYELRTLKLKRLPRDVLHTTPTSILYSLEAFPDLDWEKLLKFQSADGSFLSSPSSTAFALINTRDAKCFNYIEQVVHKFNGGAPCCYPMDLMGRIWAVDRLQRLGVSRYFEAELKVFMSYVHSYWNERGIGPGRYFSVADMDDTSMGLRLLRLYGYETSPDVLQHFRNGDEFVTYQFQATESVTPIFNLYRASQIMFPGEKILEDAKKFSYNFLLERHSMNQFSDKWVISKDIPSEIAFALDVPWYACLPRIEARSYLDQYGGESDCWIGKVCYRFNVISNNDYLEFAKLDYKYCQAVHQLEWEGIQKWYKEYNLEASGISRENLLLAYFVASASIFEPERSKERLAWAKTSVLIDMFANFLEKEESFNEQMTLFIHELNSSVTQKHPMVRILLRTIKDLSAEATPQHCIHVHHHLCDAWKRWLMASEERRGWSREEGELIARTIITCAGRFSDEMLLHPQYKRLSQLTNKICHQLPPFQMNQVHDNSNTTKTGTAKVDRDMQELVHEVLVRSPNDIDSCIKQTFLAVAKSFYYQNLFSPDTVKSHIDRVLFQNVH